MSDHVEKMEGGGLACRHCGGSVDADGYSTGGMVGEDEAMQEGITDETPQQYEATQRMRKRSLADALDSRRGD